MEIDCKIVEKPPKLITNDARTTAINCEGILESSMLPFVISTRPCKNAERGAGKSEKTGEIHSIIMKNIVITQPTHKTERVEFRIISPISKEACLCLFSSKASSFLMRKFLKQTPFKIAPKMWLVSKI